MVTLVRLNCVSLFFGKLRVLVDLPLARGGTNLKLLINSHF